MKKNENLNLGEITRKVLQNGIGRYGNINENKNGAHFTTEK